MGGSKFYGVNIYGLQPLLAGGFGEKILEILSALGAILGLQRAIDRYTVTERL